MQNNPRNPVSIEPAELEWQDSHPVSKRFGDVYVCRENGLEEARHVFLEQNRLPERFAALEPGEAFVVAETGFGTGLNFLATWQAFNSHAPVGTILHFVSVERYPLAPDDIARALSRWPELGQLAAELMAGFPVLTAGCHRLVMGSGQARLTLYLGDVAEALDQLDFTADAWLLDGFSPARNPEIWDEAVISQVRRHSAPGTTVTSFTSVGRVRRSLADTGFVMEQAPGYGGKNEMLRGQLPGEPLPEDLRAEGGRTVLVVGAGIAGCLLARNLADRGFSVTVADAGDGPGAGASGNPQGALYAKLGVEFNDQARLALSSLLFAQQFYPSQAPAAWHPTGLLMMAFSEKEQSRQDKFLQANRYPQSVLTAVDARQAADLTGVPCPSGGLWFPGSGWLEPARVCAQVLDHPNIRGVFGFRATRLLPCNNRWCLSGEGQQDLVADHVVLAAGHRTRALMPVIGEFRMKAIRGQITRIPEKYFARTPKAVITGERYLNPPAGGELVAGATFDLHYHDPEVSPDSHQENLDSLESMLPGVLEAPPGLASELEGRVAFRCTTHDYQPIAGAMVNGHRQPLDGAWLLTGFGSKGLMWAPLMAEYLADLISRQPRALPLSLARRVDPARCLPNTN